MQNPQGLNLQRRKNTKYTFAPANRSDSALLSGTQPVVEEIIKGKDRKKQVTGRYGALPVLVITPKSPENHLTKGDMINGHEKSMQRQSLFWGCLCILLARYPKISSGIQVGKRMEWWIIPKGNPMKVAATGGGMYRRA